MAQTPEDKIDQFNRIIAKFNNVEWTGDGDPLFSIEQMIAVAVEYASEETKGLKEDLSRLESRIKDLENKNIVFGK